MEFTEVLYDVSDKIATVTLNRPDKLNAWTSTMDRQYRRAMADAESRDDVRVIIVTGAGKGFCAGADMGLLQAIGSDNATVGGNGSGEPLAEPGLKNNPRADFRAHYSWPPSVHKPIIAAINGAAAGLGFVHALYCDMRFASDTAKFTTAFAQRGLIAEYGLAWLLPRVVGMHNAMDLLLSARVIKADEAHSMGLVGKVFPHNDLMPAVREYAKQLTTLSSPRSHAVMKRQVWDAQFTDLASALDLAEKEMLESLACSDFREGVASFVEKRAPQFTGK
ncbi:MAG: enoyl-CoA hydratase [Candidatus Hydrogenedentota bacterium]